MLQTAAGEPAVAITNLLKEIEPDKPTGLEARCSVAAFLAARRRSMIQQAGLDWTLDAPAGGHGG